MVRTVQEPIATTPQILRVSTSSATSSRRHSGSPSQPLFINSTNNPKVSSQNFSISTVRNRPVLGERSDNVVMTFSPQARSVKKPKIKATPKHRASPKKSLSSLSRFIAQSPQKLTFSTSQIPSSSPAISLASPDASFLSRPGSTPFPSRMSLPMSMQLNEEDTLLLEVRPPELDFSSPGYGVTDDEEDIIEVGRREVNQRGGLMTPANSRELQNGSPQRTITVTRRSPMPKSVRHPVSRLPTPPPSQADTNLTPLPLLEPTSSRASRVRPRPAKTPPRRVSTEPSVVLNDITAEWDTPLRMGHDPSPNPRRKKSPRLDQIAAESAVAALRLSSPFTAVDRLEVVLPSGRRSLGRSSASATPATVKGSARSQVSASRTPSASLSQSTSNNDSQARARAVKRSSVSSRRASVKITPAQKRSQVIPSTAPAVSRRSITPGNTQRRAATQTPKTVAAKGRRKSSPGGAAAKTPRSRSRKSMTPSLQDILSGRKLGFLPRPIHGSPGDDPLLLKGEDDVVLAGPEIRDEVGLGLRLAAHTAEQPVSNTMSSQLSPNLSNQQLGHDNSGSQYFDVAPAWSDDGSDDEAVGEDTFIHVLSRRGADFASTSRSLEQAITEEEAEDENEDKEEVEKQESNLPAITEITRGPESPFVPPRFLESVPDAADNSYNEADLTQDGDSWIWDVSLGQIEPHTIEAEAEESEMAGEGSGQDILSHSAESPVYEETEVLGGRVVQPPVVQSDLRHEEVDEVTQSDKIISGHLPHSPAPIDHAPVQLDYSSTLNPFRKDVHALRPTRAASVPRSPFVLIKDRSAVTASPISDSPRSPRAQSVPVVSRMFDQPSTGFIKPVQAEAKEDAITVHNRAGPLERPVEVTEPNTHDATLEEETHSPEDNDIYISAIHRLPDSERSVSPMQVAKASPEVTETEEEVEEGSDVGDVTADADSTAWDLSSADIESGVNMRGSGLHDERKEDRGQEGMEALERRAKEPTLEQQGQGTCDRSGLSADKQNRQNIVDGGEEEEQGEEDEEDEEKEEEGGVTDDAAEPDHFSPPPQEVPEKIVLRLVETGIIKLEPESEDEGDPPAVHNAGYSPDETDHQSQDIHESQLATAAASRTEIEPSSADGSGHDRHLSSEISSPARSTTPHGTPPPARLSMPSTPSVYPSLVAFSRSSSPSQPPYDSLNTPSNSVSIDRSEMVHPHASTTPAGSKAFGRSKLSQQITYSSPLASPPANLENTTRTREADTIAKDDEKEQDGDRSVVVRQPRRSLHDEIVAIAANEENDDVGNESFRSVVEVSSLDPKAAARAAAILKLNHAYIERGILPKSTAQEAAYSQNHGSQINSLPSHEIEKRVLLHEAELEIVESQRRSRSRSLSRARSMSVLSFATDDFPIPGGYVKTPIKRKRARTPRPLARERLNPTVEVDDRSWGVPEWKRLEKVYRHEKQAWRQERAVRPMPGGLMAWARRSTLGSSTNHVNEWDTDKVVDQFLKVEGKHDGGEWDRATIVLRVQAIESRINKCEAMSQSTLSNADNSSITDTPANKRSRYDPATLSISDRTLKAAATNLQTPKAATDSSANLEPPSTIRRMLGLVWGRGKRRETGKSLLGRFEEMSDNKGEGKETEVLPTTMKEVRPVATFSNREREVREIATPASSSIPPPPRTAHRPPPSASSAAPTSLTFPAASSSASISSSITTTPAPSRLYPPLNPPMTQRSNAIAALFPDHSSSLTSSVSTPSLSRSMTIPPRPMGGSVRNLVKSFEDKGLLARTCEDSNEQGLRRVMSGSSARV